MKVIVIEPFFDMLDSKNRVVGDTIECEEARARVLLGNNCYHRAFIILDKDSEFADKEKKEKEDIVSLKHNTVNAKSKKIHKEVVSNGK